MAQGRKAIDSLSLTSPRQRQNTKIVFCEASGLNKGKKVVVFLTKIPVRPFYFAAEVPFGMKLYPALTACGIFDLGLIGKDQGDD